MEPICKLLVYVITLLLLPVSILSLPECNFPAVFNFGDSNSDTGALVAMFGQAAARPPNGETFFGSPAGRVCDGRLLIDFIGTYSEYIYSICCRFLFEKKFVYFFKKKTRLYPLKIKLNSSFAHPGIIPDPPLALSSFNRKTTPVRFAC
ncbi:putative alpha-L-fucosidase [Helianthus debilis subsp. tardiflorus]